MLLELRIQNLVLIEDATVQLKNGFNILTGETGSGKSAIMAALELAAGERADLNQIRQGAERGVVEALFQLSSNKELNHLLSEAGIDAAEDEPLILRREISASGRGRAFLNQRPVHVSFLRALKPYLFDFVGQHSTQTLLHRETHRELLDRISDIEGDAAAFKKEWQLECTLREELRSLLSKESERIRDIGRFTAELEELKEANLKEEEEETLFQEYTLLTHSDELKKKVSIIYKDLKEERRPIITALRHHLQLLEELIPLDSTFNELQAAFHTSLAELEECALVLGRYHSSIEHSPEKQEAINERLQLITKMKRKYGATIAEVRQYESETKEKLEQLENSDQKIEELKTSIEKLQKKNDLMASALTSKRKEGAETLSALLTQELRALNMPKVQIFIEINKQNRSLSGDDHVEFFMAPNVGERAIAIAECASGGELSRFYLCIQTLLAGKQSTPCLIFDEIDANIGGETANIVGIKIAEIAKTCQVICITHFPQVATHAHHHLHIYKKEVHGRTQAFIESLDEKARTKELKRMIGSYSV